MPVQSGRSGNRCWVRWGNAGTKYLYTCGDKQSRAQAMAKVDKDRRRIEYFKRK